IAFPNDLIGRRIAVECADGRHQEEGQHHHGTGIEGPQQPTFLQAALGRVTNAEHHGLEGSEPAPHNGDADHRRPSSSVPISPQISMPKDFNLLYRVFRSMFSISAVRDLLNPFRSNALRMACFSAECEMPFNPSADMLSTAARSWVRGAGVPLMTSAGRPFICTRGPLVSSTARFTT